MSECVARRHHHGQFPPRHPSRARGSSSEGREHLPQRASERGQRPSESARDAPTDSEHSKQDAERPAPPNNRHENQQPVGQTNRANRAQGEDRRGMPDNLTAEIGGQVECRDDYLELSVNNQNCCLISMVSVPFSREGSRNTHRISLEKTGVGCRVGGKSQSLPNLQVPSLFRGAFENFGRGECVGHGCDFRNLLA